MKEPFVAKCDQIIISEKDKKPITKDFIIEAMRKMSNWLASNNLIQGGYRIPEEGSGGLGVTTKVIVGNVGLWNITKEKIYLERIIKDADFLIHSIELGGLDMDYALWVVSHYLKEVLPVKKIKTYQDMAVKLATETIQEKDYYGTHLDSSANFQHLAITALSWAILYYFDRSLPAVKKINDKISKFFDPAYGWAIGDGTVRYSSPNKAKSYDDWARCDLDLHYDIGTKNYLHRAWYILKLCGKDIRREEKKKIDFGDTAVESYYVPGWKNNFRCTKRHRWIHSSVPFELSRLLMKSAYNHNNPYRAWMSKDIIRCLRVIQQDDGSMPDKMFNSPCRETYQCNRTTATATTLASLAEVLESWYEPQIKPKSQFYALNGTSVARGKNYYIQVTGPGAIIDEITGHFRYHIYEAQGTLIKGGNYAWYSPKTERMMTDSPIETGQTTLVSINNILYGTMSDTKATQEIISEKDSKLNGKKVKYIAYPTTPDGENKAPIKVENLYSFYEDYVILKRKLIATSNIKTEYIMDKHCFRIPFDISIYFNDGAEHKVIIPHQQRRHYSIHKPADVAVTENPHWVYITEHGFGMVIQHMEALRLRIHDSNDLGNMSGYQLGYLIFDYPNNWSVGEERTTRVVLLNAKSIEEFREKIDILKNKYPEYPES